MAWLCAVLQSPPPSSTPPSLVRQRQPARLPLCPTAPALARAVQVHRRRPDTATAQHPQPSKPTSQSRRRPSASTARPFSTTHRPSHPTSRRLTSLAPPSPLHTPQPRLPSRRRPARPPPQNPSPGIEASCRRNEPALRHARAPGPLRAIRRPSQPPPTPHPRPQHTPGTSRPPPCPSAFEPPRPGCHPATAGGGSPWPPADPTTPPGHPVPSYDPAYHAPHPQPHL